MMNISACKIKEEYFHPDNLPAAREIGKFVTENQTVHISAMVCGMVMSSMNDVLLNCDFEDSREQLAKAIYIALAVGYIEGRRTAAAEQEAILMGMDPGNE